MKRDVLFKWNPRPLEDGYYVSGEKTNVPDGYWQEGVNTGDPPGGGGAGSQTGDPPRRAGRFSNSTMILLKSQVGSLMIQAPPLLRFTLKTVSLSGIAPSLLLKG